MEALLNVFSAFGLSASAGLNAYLPVLMVGLLARYTNMVTLSEPWNVLANEWVLLVVAILTLIEMTADKIPVVDSMNDAVQTIGRPAAGAILFAANSGVIGEMSPVIACIAGLLVAGTVHAAKSTARPMVTGATMGAGNWVVSLFEDFLAFIGTILAIIMPFIMMMLVVSSLTLFGVWYGKRRFQTA